MGDEKKKLEEEEARADERRKFDLEEKRKLEEKKLQDLKKSTETPPLGKMKRRTSSAEASDQEKKVTSRNESPVSILKGGSRDNSKEGREEGSRKEKIRRTEKRRRK